MPHLQEILIMCQLLSRTTVGHGYEDIFALGTPKT